MGQAERSYGKQAVVRAARSRGEREVTGIETRADGAGDDGLSREEGQGTGR